MPSPDGRRATLAAVAREAGVSLPTVSKVVNGRDDVSEETRSRIEQLLAAHQYVGWGQGRRKTAVRSVCLVFDTFQNPYAMEISRGVMQAAAEAGIDVAISLTSVSTPGVTWADRVIRSGPEGLILVTTTLTDAQRAHFARARLPLVLIDPINLPGPEVVSIGATNWTGAVSATAHLLDLGHRRIGAIIGRPETIFGRARLHGYRAALDDAGVPADPELTRPGEFTYESGYEHALSLLTLPDRPTAIFASSDVQALGVLEAARVAGIAVPVQAGPAEDGLRPSDDRADAAVPQLEQVRRRGHGAGPVRRADADHLRAGQVDRIDEHQRQPGPGEMGALRIAQLRGDQDQAHGA